ncbi:MAG: PAS domain S-box protein [Rhizomicrobium sp.]
MRDTAITNQGLQNHAAPTGTESLLSRERHFRKVLDELPAAIYTTDPLGRITYYNEAAALLWGHAPAIGTSEWCGSWKLFWPDGTPLPHGDCPMAVAIRERRMVRGIEAIAERPDGTRVPFMPYPTPIFDEAGALIGAVNMLVDLSDRKKTEEFHARLSAIVESSDDAIIGKDLTGRILSWNRAAERLFGYAAAEAVGQSITILIPPDRLDEEALILSRIRSNERVEHYETIRRRKDGSLLELSITVSPIRDSGGRVVGASKIARDITEQKRTQEQRDLLLGEMKHRTRNFAAVIDAIARQSRPSDAPQAAAILDLFVGRLRALLSAGEIAVDSASRYASLQLLFETTLRPFRNPHQQAQISIGGPPIEVSEQTAGGLALAVHELATNALKYGALKTKQGHVSLAWSVDGAGRAAIEWRERGGEPIAGDPTRRGFGSRVIKSAVSGEPDGKTTLRFERDGVCCRFEFQMRAS